MHVRIACTGESTVPRHRGIGVSGARVQNAGAEVGESRPRSHDEEFRHCVCLWLPALCFQGGDPHVVAYRCYDHAHSISCHWISEAAPKQSKAKKPCYKNSHKRVCKYCLCQCSHCTTIVVAHMANQYDATSMSLSYFFYCCWK